MRECVQREVSIAAPWVVKPSIAKAFGIETQQSDDVESKNKEIRDGKLAKRRKVGGDGAPAEPATKRRKTGMFLHLSESIARLESDYTNLDMNQMLALLEVLVKDPRKRSSTLSKISTSIQCRSTTVESFVESRLKFLLYHPNRFLIEISPSLQNVSTSSSKLGICSALSRERHTLLILISTLLTYSR